MQVQGSFRVAALAAVLSAVVLAGEASAATTEPPAPLSVELGAERRSEGHTVRAMMFKVRVGARDEQVCQLEAELSRPDGASARKPVPALMTTNGFGGSVSGQRKFSAAMARRGYAVMNYSGLGWGKSGCKISLDDPDTDGRAARQLVSFLGGARTPGADPIDWIRRDARGHDDRAYDHDPRIGLFGGSYGGGFQYATVKDDARVDTIVPAITWNDLRYSLSPDNADLGDGVTPKSAGSVKTIWGVGFFSLGLVNGLQGLPVDALQRTLVCPGFTEQICLGAVPSVATGGATDGLAQVLEHASVASYVDRIRIPTLLAQGQKDSLFNLNESLATYRALKRQGTPVKLIWHHWGHSGAGPRPGEWDESYKTTTYEGTAFLEWFDHYLKDDPKAPSLDFTYYRPWATYDGDASPAYARSEAYPADGRTDELRLSADGTIRTDDDVVPGAPGLLTTLLGLPTGLTTFDLSQFGGAPMNVPGTYTSFTSAPLEEDTDVVGTPKLTVRLDPGLGEVTGPLLGDLGLPKVYVRLEDVSPDGSVLLPGEQVSAVGVPTDGREVEITLPGIVHRFQKGHRYRLTVAGGDLSYRGNVVPTPVSVVVDRAAPPRLRLPIVPASQQAPIVRAAVPATAGSAKRRRPKVSRVRLTPRRVSLRTSTAGRVRVRIARRVVRRVRSGGKVRIRRVWRTSRSLTLRASKPRTVRRRIKRLPVGRYRVTTRLTAPDGTTSKTRHAIRRIRR
ncbi:MAG: CocE/NonD family hydrolase [Solirubrobacteraceae bacterium]